jgi:hypothetical protein
MMDERKAERELFGNHWAAATRSYRRPSRFERLAREQNAAIRILREHLPPRSYSVARPPL